MGTVKAQKVLKKVRSVIAIVNIVICNKVQEGKVR